MNLESTPPASVQAPAMTERSDYSRADLTADLHALGLSWERLASSLGLSMAAVYAWGSVRPIPRWVPVLMAAWRDNQRLKLALGEIVAQEPTRRRRRASKPHG